MEDLKYTWGTEIGGMFKDLSKIVLADGTFTSDERKLILTLNKDVNKFVGAFIEALEDDIITQEENNQLRRLWLKIQENAEETALIDQIITPDERKILIRIAETISKRLDKK